MGRVKELMQVHHEEEPQTRTVRMRVLRPVFSREVLRENLPAYITTDRYNSPYQIFELFRDLVKESREQVIALHLDGKNRIVCFDRVAIGSLNQAIIHPRDLFKSALLSSASAIILVHNHPTGDSTPSREDVEITRRLCAAGDLLGVKIIDHIIVGDAEWVSFADRGLL